MKAIYEGRAADDPTREHVTLLQDGMLVPLDGPPYVGRLGDVVDVHVFQTARGPRIARLVIPAGAGQPASPSLPMDLCSDIPEDDR